MVKFKKGDIMNRFFALSVLFFSTQVSCSSSNKLTGADHRAAVKTATLAAMKGSTTVKALREIPAEQERMGQATTSRSVADVVEHANRNCPDCKLGGRECWVSCWMSLFPPKGGLTDAEVNSCCSNPYGHIAVPCMLIGGTCCCGCNCCDSPE